MLAWAGTAHALTVEVVAPEKLRPLLLQHLEAARAAQLGEILSDEEVNRLRSRSLESARELLATQGYFSPRIDSSLTRENNDWRLLFSVEPGALTLVRSVNIRFAGAVAEADEASRRLRGRIEREFGLQAPMPFRQTDWEAAKQTALNPLLSGVFVAARLAASEARIDPAMHSADLSLTLDSGPAFFYGKPVINGNRRYLESIIQNLNPAKPGQPYRQQDLLDYQIALEESGYFAHASVRIDSDPALAAAAPILVDVVERPFKLFSFGVGYSTDTGARLQGAWLHRDINDRGLRLKLDARLEKDSQQGGVELSWPRNRSGYENSIGLQRKQEDIAGQETQAVLAAAKRSRKRGEIEITQSLQYQTEQQSVGNVPSLSNRALTANLAWTRRRLGHDFYPRRGDVLSLQVGGAGEMLLSDTSFLRLHGRYTRYFRAGNSGRVILRGELGSVLADTRDGIPTDFLFRAGGDNSVRGYAYQSLGRALGGGVASVRYLATGSAEYNYFFNNDWGMALFVDVGDAADSLSSLSPEVGVGVGVRYRTPVGPLNLDLAYGQATEKYRLHFSLGVSF